MRSIAALAALVLAGATIPALAQKAAPKPAPAKPAAERAAVKPVPMYFYMVDNEGNRVLVQSQFALDNADSEARVLRRLVGVVDGLEQRGFRRDASVSISDWDKKEKFAKCYVYLEDEESGRGKGTGARVWCSESGISEVAVQPSDDPKHVDRVLERFTFFLAKAKEGLKN
jgi:hypothetical protein